MRKASKLERWQALKDPFEKRSSNEPQKVDFSQNHQAGDKGARR